MSWLSSVVRGVRTAPPLLIIALLFTLVVHNLIPILYRDGWQFSMFLNGHDKPVALLTALILALVFFPFRRYAWIESLLRWLAAHPVRVAVLMGLSLAFASYFIYQKWPVTMDEYSPWFQAHVFASGSLVAQYPLDTLNYLFEKSYHSNFFVINWETGKVASVYWPGFALLLTPFAFADVAWLCNPVLVALSVITLHRLAIRLGFSVEQQGWIILLAVASPAFTLNGISFYSMPAHLLLNSLFALCLVRPTPRRFFMAGLIGGFALCLHNPLPHLAFALPWLVWYAFYGEERLKRIALLLAGYLPFSLLLGLGWILLTRDVKSASHMQPLLDAAPVAAAQTKPFLASLAGYFQFFTLPDARILNMRIGGFFKLWLWAVPLLVILAIVAIRRAETIYLRLLAASAVSVFLAYFFIPFSQGHGWGYRYFHPAWFTLPFLAVVALRDRELGEAFSARLAVCALASLLLITPVRAWQMGTFVSGHVAQFPLAKEHRTNAECELVFHNLGGFYGVDMVENKPALKACQLIFISRGYERDMEFAELLAPGGHAVARDAYGWIYRYPAANKPE